MLWDADRLQRAWTSLAAWMRSRDWYVIVLIVGFVLVAPIPGVKGGSIISPLLWLSRLLVTDPFAAYQDAVAAAALKRPEYRRPLKMINSATVNVVTFRRSGNLPLQHRTKEIWVALRDDVHDACVGAADPVRMLQQILGLPPVAAASNVVTELEVRPDGLFRPCIGPSNVEKQTCDLDFDFEVPNPPDPPAAEADAAKLKEAYDKLREAYLKLRPDAPDPPAAEADAAKLREAYDKLREAYLKLRDDAAYQLRFVTKQMWNSYRMGFGDPGYPFTGMGWTYNWGSSSPDHFGVTEFVLKRDAVIERIASEKSPEDFCRKPS
jgi:hypothetical protein